MCATTDNEQKVYDDGMMVEQNTKTAKQGNTVCPLPFAGGDKT